MTEIVDLIKIGNNSLLKEKLKDSPSLADGVTEQGISFLQFSAYCRNQEAIALFRSYRKDIDIFEAASIGEKEALLRILKNNPDQIKTFSIDCFTPLGLASFFGHIVLVKMLLDKGANPNIAAKQFNVTPLHSACAVSN